MSLFNSNWAQGIGMSAPTQQGWRDRPQGFSQLPGQQRRQLPGMGQQMLDRGMGLRDRAIEQGNRVRGGMFDMFSRPEVVRDQPERPNDDFRTGAPFGADGNMLPGQPISAMMSPNQMARHDPNLAAPQLAAGMDDERSFLSKMFRERPPQMISQQMARGRPIYG